ncbi:hypothetical protein HHL16_24315 [Pseudoflavitalea sp. G-6-1-2]|uniref:hypothetical protein n=1 Tax=Pseudoflavitalea sp. G-6-1-2 TaxID=2728841 RepID=UPI00146BA4D2|nr:hypothetical protein [Pseudoflavitalea sp. G-6-1-2]NML24024.1 hypothetical protein [Pseudoflavitalea sp. G-6-1-2]
MAKEFYNVTYKTYLNDRVKAVPFRDSETFPLYIQITYDRRTTAIKSYYFEIFQQVKYDYTNTSLRDIEQLENNAINYVINWYSEKFDLNLFPAWYRMFSKDILESLDIPFKNWLAAFLQKQKISGFGALIEAGIHQVSALQILEEIHTIFPSDLYTKMLAEAAKEAPPFIPLSAYVRTRKNTPFCLPLHEWLTLQNSQEIDDFMNESPECWGYDILKIIRYIKQLLYPKGFEQ